MIYAIQASGLQFVKFGLTNGETYVTSKSPVSGSSWNSRQNGSCSLCGPSKTACAYYMRCWVWIWCSKGTDWLV